MNPADLSKAAPRVPRQRRANPGLPEVDPRQRQRQIFGEMRNARRGGGSSEALLDALGMVSRATQDVGRVATALDEKKQRELGDRGALDAQAGTVDEELVRESYGYRNAVAVGRANTEFEKHKATVDPALETFVEELRDIDPLVARAKAAQWVEKHYFEDFALDPETRQPRDFGAPNAYRQTAENIGRFRPAILNAVYERIDDKLRREALAHSSKYIRSNAGQEGFDLNAALKMVPPQVAAETVTANILETGKVMAMETMILARQADDPIEAQRLGAKALRIVDQLLGYGEVAEGTAQSVDGLDLAQVAALPGPRILPELKGRYVVTAEQRLTMLRFRESLLDNGTRYVGAAKGRRADNIENSWAMRSVGSGAPLSDAEIVGAVERGEIDGRTGGKWIEARASLRRAEQAHAELVANRLAREELRAKEEQASRIINGYGAAVVSGQMSPAQARQKMLGDITLINDHAVRGAVLSQSESFFSGIERVRMDTPAARSFNTHMDRAESDLIGSLGARRLSVRFPDGTARTLTRQQAEALIRQQVAVVRVRGGEGFRDKGGADTQALQRELAAWFNSTFPAR